jgi:succinate dehydrogenase (ubiquinone) membrane anchor subunit
VSHAKHNTHTPIHPSIHPSIPTGLVPLAALTKEGDGAAVAVDAGLAVALPIHSHIALNYVVSDYVPRGMRTGARWGVLGSSVLAALGLARLAASEPGLTGTVKRLWHPAVGDRVRAEEAKAAAKAAKAKK